MEPGGAGLDELPLTEAIRGEGTGHRTPRHVGRGGRSEPAVFLLRYQRLVIAGDLLAAVLACLLVTLPLDDVSLVLTCALPPAWVTVVAVRGGYERVFLGNGPEEYRRVLSAGVFLFGAAAVLAFALRSETARPYVFLAVPVMTGLGVLVRWRLRCWIAGLRAQGQALQRVLVVGRSGAVVAAIEELDREPEHGLVPVGACVPFVGVEVSHLHDVPVVGDPGRVLEAVEDTGAHVVAVVSHPDLSGQALRKLSWALDERGVQLVVSPGIVEVAGPLVSVHPVAGLGLLRLHRPQADGPRLLGKEVFDRVTAIGLTVVLSPLLLALALAVRLTSRGPVLHRQRRVGAAGCEFTVVSFRCTVIDPERRRADLLAASRGRGVLFKLSRDPLVTPVGRLLRRWSLDGLPQLLNVVRGEMSLVGPRPEAPGQGAPPLKPGLTGLPQAAESSREESMRLGLRYLDNWSMALDLSILWRTLRAVVRGAGAY
ncbi:sugar transferase [Kineosporia succinea]|uniref:Lipopolysaccharide/colanic/teichoic acid biosynthesis glycosyltransferase n=1 Tax=Kineosporia succinea TaxID=84632 RepID=A0ABT9NYV6_9ACTN|nr:sugar transferase [Kineosporia succinea]MDP9825606.1 lipopolysaccharide/colanic/teichoic acid biosynthesis glycosyltransferase [Kineosporia succinea]